MSNFAELKDGVWHIGHRPRWTWDGGVPLTDAELAEHNWFPVRREYPEHNPIFHVLQQAPQTAWFIQEGQLVIPHVVVDKPIEEAQVALQQTIIEAAQQRLDTFAQTRNYDGILSACTYATSTVPSFQAEGQAAVNLRDSTWAALYTILAEVQAGTRPMPTGFGDIETDLPLLEWPA